MHLCGLVTYSNVSSGIFQKQIVINYFAMLLLKVRTFWFSTVLCIIYQLVHVAYQVAIH